MEIIIAPADILAPAVGVLALLLAAFLVIRLWGAGEGASSAAVWFAALLGGFLARTLLDSVLNVVSFASTVAFDRRGVVGASLVVDGAFGLLMIAGVLLLLRSARSNRAKGILVACIIGAAVPGVFNIPQIAAIAVPPSGAEVPGSLWVFEEYGRQMAWAACLLAAVLGTATRGDSTAQQASD